MEDSIRLKLVQQSPRVIGDNIYGSVIRDVPSGLGAKLCCLNPKWANEECSQWTGVAAEYVRQLNEGGARGTPHLVNIDDRLYVVKAVKLEGRWSKYRDTDIFNLKELKKSIEAKPELATVCLGVNKFSYQYIGCDDFANEILIGSLVRAAFENEKSMPPLYNKIYTQSMCGSYGLILMDYAEKTDLYSFSARPDLGDFFTTVQVNFNGRLSAVTAVKPEATWLIMKQVACALDFLQGKIEFVHSDLKAQNVLLSTRPSTGTYKGVNLSGKLSARISDYGNASATIKSTDPIDKDPIRFFNEIRATRYVPGLSADFELKAKTGTNCFQVGVGGAAKCGDALWWKLPSNFDYKMSLITAHSGLPFYRSYDWYIFMVSIMMCENFFNSILSDAKLKGILWDSLWLGEELNGATLEVKKSHGKRPSLERALDFLKNRHMRCDALPNAIENMKS